MSSIKVRKTAIIILTASIWGLSAPAYALFGGGGNAKEVTQVASWAIQYKQMVEELETLWKTYNSINGPREVGKMFNHPELRGYLPADFNEILSRGYGDWENLRELLNNPKKTSKMLASEILDQLAKDEAANIDAFKEASRRIKDIQGLLDQIKDMPDAKSINDLQARIMAEQVMIQNESVKLDMLKRLQDLQKEKHRNEVHKANLSVIESAGVLEGFSTTSNTNSTPDLIN